MNIRNTKRFLFLSIISITIFLLATKTAYALWWDDTTSQTAFLKQANLQPYLKEFDGGIVKLIFVQLGWLIIKLAYLITSTIQNLVPKTLDLFSFVESPDVNQVYQSVLNTVVVGLMILSLIFIGYKLIIGKGTVDLKSVGMNVVMSVCLILLMPTMIHSGVEFAKIFYKDSVSISGGNGDIAWSLIKNGVTDLAYINKSNRYNEIDNLTKRNNLKKDMFYRTDLGQVLTSDLLDEMEKENPKAENLRYTLIPDSDGEMVATKFDDGFFSIFSDSLKTGYYRYPTNMWGLLLSLIALATAYVFSAFIIISAIIELAFKRVVGVVVFATDLETGQRSKMVLTDILQCYLTIGFQGFGLGLFGLFVSYLNSGSGASTNPFIKIIAYIVAVVVLIKGSSTIMRYFGVDIGLKEGYGQLASAFGLGAMVARKGASAVRKPMTKQSNGNNTSDSDNQDNRQAEKNFGESLATKAKDVGNKFGYARERGLSGLASDGLSKVGEKTTKSFKDMRNVARGGLDGFKDGLTEGTVSAIEKNSRAKASTAQDNSKYDTSMPTRLANRQDGAKTESADRVVSSSERMRALANGGSMSAVQQKVQQDIEQRRKALHNTGTSSAEEIINQKRNEAKYTPKAMTRDEMIRQRTQGLTGANTSNREVPVRENVQGVTGTTNRTVDVRENLQGSTSSQSRTVDVRENVQGATGATNRTVDVRENLQGSTSSQPRTVDVKENIHTQRNQTDMGDKTQKINIVENRQEAKKVDQETVTVNKEVKETKRKRFTYEDNDLFRDRSNDYNPLFDR